MEKYCPWRLKVLSPRTDDSRRGLTVAPRWSAGFNGLQVDAVNNSPRSQIFGKALVIGVAVAVAGGLVVGAYAWRSNAGHPKAVVAAPVVAPPAAAPSPTQAAPSPIPVPTSSLVADVAAPTIPVYGAPAVGKVPGSREFAERYVQQEGRGTGDVDGRCYFDRYRDFTFYTQVNWYDGRKVPLLIAEAESNSNELLGELSGLLSVRCPYKYLFIDGQDTLNRLKEFCQPPANLAVDWGNTTYHVIEIPNDPSPPSHWTGFMAHTTRDGDQLVFVGPV